MVNKNQSVKKTLLGNGVRIITGKTPHVRSVSLGIWVDVGTRDEALQQSGISHFMEHMLFKGTKMRSAYQLAKEFDAIGGQTNAFTSMENTCFQARVMDSHLEIMTDIFSDIFLNSEFSEQEMENERPVILQEIGMTEDCPEDHIHALFERDTWGDHPLGRSILGTRDTVAAIDRKMIRDFMKKMYQPDRIVISAAGNIEHDSFVEMIGPTFETIPKTDMFPERKAPQIHLPVSVTERELEQVHLCLGTKGIAIGDPRRHACSIMNTILGGNMSSRLFQEVREKRGLSYSVFSFPVSYTDAGTFGMYAGIAPENVLKTAELMISELKRLKSDPVSASELRNAKEFTRGNLLLAAESTETQMMNLAQNELNFGRHIPIEESIQKLESVTAEEILELAGDLFDIKRPAITLLGPVKETQALENLSLT